MRVKVVNRENFMLGSIASTVFGAQFTEINSVDKSYGKASHKPNMQII